MSKMSWLHATLTQQAAELGFRSIEEAEANGYGVNYDNKKIVKIDEQELAHKAWLKEKEELLKDLRFHVKYTDWVDITIRDDINRAIKFIEGVKHE